MGYGHVVGTAKVGNIWIQHPLCNHFLTAKSEACKIFTVGKSEGPGRPQAFDCKLPYYGLLDSSNEVRR